MRKITMKRDYIFKVWGSTIVAAPVLMMLATTFLLVKQGDKMDSGAFGFIAFEIGYGLVLSIPTFLIVYLLFRALSKKVHNPVNLKLILWLTGVICVLVTFYLLYGSDAYNLNGNYAALSFSVTYFLCLTLFSFIYPILPKHTIN